MERKDCKTGTAKYDPTRKYRTGDKVRFIHRGRRNYLVTPENGEECTVIENEKQEQVLIKCCGYTAVFHFADLELVKPVEEIEKEDTQTCTPDEACNNPAAEQALVTEEELQKAIDHVVDLVGRYDGRVVVAAFIEGDNTTRRIFRAANEVFASNGMNTKIYGWTGACGFLLKANECFDCNAKTMGEGVRLFLEQQNKEKMRRGMNPIADMLGIAGCECEECQD